MQNLERISPGQRIKNGGIDLLLVILANQFTKVVDHEGVDFLNQAGFLHSQAGAMIKNIDNLPVSDLAVISNMQHNVEILLNKTETLNTIA